MPVTPVFNVTDPYEGFTQTFTSKRGFESLLCIVVDGCSRCSWVKPFFLNYINWPINWPILTILTILTGNWTVVSVSLSVDCQDI